MSILSAESVVGFRPKLILYRVQLAGFDLYKYIKHSAYQAKFPPKTERLGYIMGSRLLVIGVN
jgi:hypothetical protein